MRKILLIEPLRVVRQAIALALFPEHEVEARESVGSGSPSTWKDYELIILDGTALRELGQLAPELVRAVQSSETPTLWLEEDESHRPPRRANLVVVKKPIEREAFCSAVAELLSPPGAAKKRGKSAVASTTEADAPKGPAKGETGELGQESSRFVDLVDVVEEEGSRGEKNAPRKPK